MIDLRTKAEVLRTELMEVIKPKLLFQFKRPEKNKEVTRIVNNIIQHRMEELSLDIRREYQFFIPIPTANLKTRLKFLFTGKLR